jgi:hypothetical protein
MKTRQVRSATLLWCVALLSVVSQHSLHADEPVYEGRSVSSWLQDFAYGRFPDMDKHRAAERAIRSIGAEAIPILTERLRVTADGLDQVQDMHTVSAFEALGTQARPAIPVLVELLAPAYDAARESPSEPNAQLTSRKTVSAALALQAIGQASVGPLIKALTAEDVKIRFGAAMALEYFPRQEQDVIPALVKTLGDKDCDVRWRSARSIGTLHAMPELSVPALAERLRNDPATNVRCYAIFALAKFGDKAEASVPDLTRAASDPDSVIRSYARDALKAIAPAVATKKDKSKR